MVPFRRGLSAEAMNRPVFESRSPDSLSGFPRSIEAPFAEPGSASLARDVVGHLEKACPVSERTKSAGRISLPSRTAQLFGRGRLIPRITRRLGRAIHDPAVFSIAIALAVIAGVIVSLVMERIDEFPASRSARKMLTAAASVRRAQLNPLEAEAGSLGDFFFMKYHLERYDVPPEFANLHTSAYRIFYSDDGGPVAQITVPAKRMQLFLFPAARHPTDGKPLGLSGWRFVDHDGWTGALQVRHGICFMAATRNGQKELALYLADARARTSAGAGH